MSRSIMRNIAAIIFILIASFSGAMLAAFKVPATYAIIGAFVYAYGTWKALEAIDKVGQGNL